MLNRNEKFETILGKINKNVFFGQSHCFDTTSELTRLMANNSPLVSKADLYKNNFLEIKEETNGEFKKLFTEPSVPEHLIFNFTIYPDMHGFIIEKESDGKEVSWRVYHSWLKTFNLHQWLGVKEWPLSNGIEENLKSKHQKFRNFINENYENYGKGKSLNSAEVKEFLISVFSFCKNDSRMKWYSQPIVGTIKTYEVDSCLFEKKELISISQDIESDEEFSKLASAMKIF